MRESELVPGLEDSPISLSLVELDGDELRLEDATRDSLLFVVAGSGSLAVAGETHALTEGAAALVLAGEGATVEGRLELLRATVGEDVDRHAPLGSRETVVRLDERGRSRALGSRSYQVLLGPANGSTRATLFAGYLPPGRSPWHFHLYDEVVWVRDAPARLHLAEGIEEVAAGSAFRLRPRQVHTVENASPDRELGVIGIFTPAGSPSAAYLAEP